MYKFAMHVVCRVLIKQNDLVNAMCKAAVILFFFFNFSAYLIRLLLDYYFCHVELNMYYLIFVLNYIVLLYIYGLVNRMKGSCNGTFFCVFSLLLLMLVWYMFIYAHYYFCHGKLACIILFLY